MKDRVLEGLGSLFRALRHRNYRLFFAGQSVSLIGTWMQQMAASWLVYRLTNSAFVLGVVGFASQLPTFLLSPFAGVVADRLHRHRILVITQVLSMAQACVLAALVMTGAVQVWHIIAASLLLGVIFAFDNPARHSFVVEMISSREDLGNAIALNSLVFNFARLIGPSLAGILIALTGEGVCFLLNAVSFLPVIVALSLMDIPRPDRASGAVRILRDLQEGVRYAFGVRSIRAILMLVAVVSFAGMPYLVLMPVFARDVLGGGSGTLGFLVGSSGVGALAGAVTLASRQRVSGVGRMIVPATYAFGAGLILFSFSRVLWASLLLMGCVGFGMIVLMVASNTLLQAMVDDEKRGRVMSLFTMSFLGVVPFGSLWIGSAASVVGSPLALAVSGFVCVLGGILLRNEVMRPDTLVH